MNKRHITPMINENVKMPLGDAAEQERIFFETARLTVRRLTEEDVDALYSVYGDAEAMRWVGDGEPFDRAGCVQWVEVTQRNYQTRGYGMSALVLRESGKVIGFCGLVHPGGQTEAEIKYALLREFWGQGLATEAARGMLDHGETVLRLPEVMATAYPENVASHRVLTKAGLPFAENRQEEDGSLTAVFLRRFGEDITLRKG